MFKVIYDSYSYSIEFNPVFYCKTFVLCRDKDYTSINFTGVYYIKTICDAYESYKSFVIFQDLLKIVDFRNRLISITNFENDIDFNSAISYKEFCKLETENDLILANIRDLKNSSVEVKPWWKFWKY